VVPLRLRGSIAFEGDDGQRVVERGGLQHQRLRHCLRRLGYADLPLLLVASNNAHVLLTLVFGHAANVESDKGKAFLLA